MIGAANAVVRRILLDGVPGLSADRVSFQPPNEDWRQRVGASPGISLNVYLAEIEDDRKRRTNAVERVVDGTSFRDTRAAERMALTYFVSAWNQTADSLAVAATEAEHDTLSFVLRALLRAVPFNAARLLAPAELATVPPGMRDADLPTTIAAPEAHDKLSQFWGTMGKHHPHKPVITLMVTVPVTYPESVADEIVYSIDTAFGADRLIEVAGRVRDAIGARAANPVPVADASVVFTTLAGRRAAGARAGGDGSFVVDGLTPGRYRLTFAADGYPPAPPVPVTLPTPSGGSLELLFT